MKEKKINQIFILCGYIIILEIIFRLLVFKNIFNIGMIYTIIFSIPLVLFFSLTKLLPKLANQISFYTITGFLTFYYAFQYCFYVLFSLPFSFATIGLANQALDFTSVVRDTVFAHWWQIILLLVPNIILIVIHRFIDFKRYKIRHAIILVCCFILFYGISLLSLLINKKELYSPYNLYYHVNSNIDNYDRFGALTATRLDIKRLIFGFEEKIILEKIETPTVVNPIEKVLVELGDNVTEINFDDLINDTNDQSLKNVHEYFKTKQPTNKSSFSGMYKGKNLIFVLAEGFNEIAVSESLTPTLYKMVNNSLVFENFYSPVFLSTIGGEFQAVTGLIPSQEILTNWKKNMVSINYGLGNSFKKIGYNAQSYHDWTYTYYGRDKYMKTIGFNDYMGCNNGMEKLISCKWLPSDLDMINSTSDLYMNKTPFMTYYVTVSGHAPYVMSNGNSMALKNKDAVKDLDYDTSIKAYLSTQIELDKAMEALLKNLSDKGILDNTVIALVGDHYPYTLSPEIINQVSSYEKDGIVEVNHSNLIIYNSTTPRTTVKKVGSQIDVLPTLLNLFGIEYDSRLIIGRDILSNQEGLAIFSNRSWVTDSGTYYSASRKFVPRDGVTVSDDYVSNMNKIVANNFAMSNYIINYDYYKKVLGSVE